MVSNSIGVSLPRQGALDVATAYAKDRQQFGKTISSFQGMQFMLADMQMQTEAARCLLYDCARMADREEWDSFSAKASMVKCFCSDTAMKVTTDAVQIFGGAGYMRDFRSSASCATPRSTRSSRAPTRSSAW